MLRVAVKLRDKLITNLSISDITKLISSRASISNSSVSVLTLSGEAVKSADGVWYYVLNKKSNNKILSDALGLVGNAFDPRERFLKQNDSKFRDIYFR